MLSFKTQAVFAGVLAAVAVLGITHLGTAPEVYSPISPDEFVRAVAAQRKPLIDMYFSQHCNPNARAKQDRPLILAAALNQDWETVRRLLKAGACVDLADETGLTPLMAASMHGNLEIINTFIPLVTNVAAKDRSGRSALHYAVGSDKAAAVLLLPLMPDLINSCRDGRDLLAMALDTGNTQIVGAVLNRIPRMSQWTPSTGRALKAALDAGNKDQVSMLLAKHDAPPTVEGTNTPLLAHAIASNDKTFLNTLLACGADPNTVLPNQPDKDFLALLPPKSLRNYLSYDRGVTVLMLAAGLGQADYVRVLLDAGADKNRKTERSKMIALYLAARTDEWRCTQMLLGSGPPPDQLRIEITLSSQQAALIKEGVPVFSTRVSTGREGYTTRAGSYVITDKNRSHRSTIYHVDMPYFMRLSCADFGMHAGVVPNYPASHGCIRLPSEAARKLFTEIPVGTLVTVK